MPSDSSVTFHIRGMLSASAAGSFSNRAEVQSETPDPDLSNNTDTIEVPIDRSADLSVIKGQSRLQYTKDRESNLP